MSHIHILFFSLSSSVRSRLLSAVTFRKLNSKSHTNLAQAFSKTCLLVHLSLYHYTSFFTRWYSFAHALPSLLVLYCVLSSTHCSQSSCTQLADVQPSPFVLCIVYIYHLQLALLLLSTILFPPFVPTLTILKLSLQVLRFVLTIDCTAGLASNKGHVKIKFAPRNSPLISPLLPLTGTDFAHTSRTELLTCW